MSFTLAIAAPAGAQTVTPVQGAGATAAPNVVAPPAEALVPGSTGASGAANVVQPPAEALTPGANQAVLPPAESLVQGAPGGLPAATAGAVGTGAGTTGVATPNTATGTSTTGTATTGTIATGLTVPPAISSAQAAQTALEQGGLAPIVTETAGVAATQVAFYGDREGARRQQQRQGAGGAPMNLVPIGTSPGSRPGAAEYIGAPITPYDSDSPDALDFSRTP